MKIAAAYIRVSTDDQIEYSPESQIKSIREYAKRNDYILPEELVFIDEGISGKKAEKRPEFMRMIGVAKTKPKPFDAILLWKFSRFARNREDSIVYKSMLRKQLGIEVVSISENVGDDKMSILIEALIEAMDEFYSINLAEEVKRGMTEKAHRGEAMTIAPYGYKIEKKKYVVDEKEAVIIRNVFDGYNKGKGIWRLASELNAMGIKTHRGGMIESRTIDYWLHNPVYAGMIRWTPSGKIRRNFDNPDSLVIKGEHEPLISEETWEATQKKLCATKARYKKYSKDNNEISHWLVSVTRCGICGRAMVNCGGYMVCSGKSHAVCKGVKSIKTESLADFVLSDLQAVVDGDKSGINVVQSSAEKTNKAGDNAVLETMLNKATAKLARVKESYEAGIDTLDEYKVNKERITKEIDELQKQLIPKPILSYDEMMPLYRKRVADVLIILRNPNATAKEKNIALRSIVLSIIRTSDNVKVEYGF